MNNSLYL